MQKSHESNEAASNQLHVKLFYFYTTHMLSFGKYFSIANS